MFPNTSIIIVIIPLLYTAKLVLDHEGCHPHYCSDIRAKFQATHAFLLAIKVANPASLLISFYNPLSPIQLIKNLSRAIYVIKLDLSMN